MVAYDVINMILNIAITGILCAGFIMIFIDDRRKKP